MLKPLQTSAGKTRVCPGGKKAVLSSSTLLCSENIHRNTKDGISDTV